MLDGVEASTHWLELETLRGLGAVPRHERVVRSGKIITAGGASAGIDLALALAAELGGEEAAAEIALSIEYDPQPRYPGSPEKAAPQIVERLRDAAAARRHAARNG